MPGRSRRRFTPGLALRAVRGLADLRATRRTDLRGQVALITGGSRGLGLALARELAGKGCRLALSARDPAELDRARQLLEPFAADVLTLACDVSDPAQITRMIEQTTAHFGRIDILINDAGLINVGPLEDQRIDDFEQAMAVMFWAEVHATLAVLPAMRARRSGQIVNITSIGGKLSVPHLLPYSAAKFAAVGFSEGLHAELAGQGINVLTVVPGLMRTGSHLNAEFKGRNREEFGWFSLAASLPITSMAADDAARHIVAAIERREAELILGWQAGLAARLHGLMPGVTVEILGLVNRLLPRPGGIGSRSASGFDSRNALSESPLEQAGRQAAREWNQL